MKRFTTLCLTACFMLLGVFTLQAQDKAQAVQDAAKEQAYELRKAFGLDENQTKELYSAIYKREKSLNFTDYSEMSKQEKMKFMAQTNDDFKKSVMNILTEEQFKKYSAWLAKKNKESKE